MTLPTDNASEEQGLSSVAPASPALPPTDGDGVVAPTSGEAADLLPCPFCGGDAALVQWRDTADPNATWVECKGCEAMVETVHDGDAATAKSRAAARWNQRAVGVDTERTLTRDELRDFAMRHGHFIIPARAGIVFTWTDKDTGEVLGRGELARGNVTPLKPTPSSERLSSDRAGGGCEGSSVAPSTLSADSEQMPASAWRCPINSPGCKRNCGNYGCGN